MALSPLDDDDINLDDILRVAKEAAQLAGAEIRQAVGDARTTTTMKSDTTDLVTETDQRCEHIVMETIRRYYPQHAIIGEESSGADCQYSLTATTPTWTVDPIDGTTNFVHGLALTCVLIGFLMDGQPVVGVTYDPMADEWFWAVKGQGAYGQSPSVVRTGGPEGVRRLRVSGTGDLTRAVVSLDAGYGRHVAAVDRYLRLQRALLLQRVRHVRVLGCCGLTLAYVAAGRLDACCEQGSWNDHTGPKIWDLAPGALIVQEAGGVTRDLTTRETAVDKTRPMDLLQRSLFAAASPQLADTLVETILSASNTNDEPE